ncbi:CreA family protein [Albidovulum sp.]|uniref:CreA family protein n=1 Tax=Albidovulum sp. TaxID=1872424 RepID=UPI0039B8B3AD
MRPASALALALALAFPAAPARAEVVGQVGVDWVGNDIVIEAIPDPKVEGVTCHVAYFDRSVLDRLSQGNWFEDPSWSALDCRKTGPVTLGDIDRGPEGESIFSERTSLIFKSLKVTRIFDAKSNTLIYLAHASELTQGSGKMSISTVPLYDAGQ